MAAKFARDLKTAGLRVTAAAGRDPGRARAFAAAHGVPGYHGSYESLLSDPSVDAVHISLPNHLHAEWSVRAALAGKHVLCEKPGALDAGECAEVLAAARRAGTFYMEGFMYRCHPQWELARALLEEGRIGRLARLESAFCYELGDRPGDNRLSAAAAGGALMDIGCYCLSFSLWFAGGLPASVRAESAFAGPGGVDLATTARLAFPGGLTASFHCSLAEPRRQSAVLHGEEGRLEIDLPWHPDPERSALRLVLPGGGIEEYHAGDGLGLFAREALAAAERLDDGECPAMTWEASLEQAKALEAVRRAAGHLGRGNGGGPGAAAGR